MTGAGQGIGRGIAKAFYCEGADVVINDLTADDRTEEVARNIQDKGRRALVVPGDVTRRADVERIFDRAWEELGPVDILCQCAGIETIIPFTEITDQQWDEVTQTNLKSEWMCSQALCRRLIAEGRKGSIINIGSIQAARACFPAARTMRPANFGRSSYSRNISAEVGVHTEFGVNCIHPRTDRVLRLIR